MEATIAHDVRLDPSLMKGLKQRRLALTAIGGVTGAQPGCTSTCRPRAEGTGHTARPGPAGPALPGISVTTAGALTAAPSGPAHTRPRPWRHATTSPASRAAGLRGNCSSCQASASTLVGRVAPVSRQAPMASRIASGADGLADRISDRHRLTGRPRDGESHRAQVPADLGDEVVEPLLLRRMGLQRHVRSVRGGRSE
jgi:hypothetical protein